MLARLLVFARLVLAALDYLARRPPRREAVEREPETITDLLGEAPVEAPAGPHPDEGRVVGWMLVCPGIGAVAKVGAAIPACGRDGAAWASVAWEARVPVHVSDVLVLPDEAGARSLLWTLRWAVPPTTEVLPVIVATGAR